MTLTNAAERLFMLISNQNHMDHLTACYQKLGSRSMKHLET